MHRVLCLTDMAVYIVGSEIFVAVEQLRRVLSDLIPVEVYGLFAILCFYTNTNALAVVVNKTNVTVTTMTANAVFIFQKIGKFLVSRLVLAVIIINAELTVRKAATTHYFISECFNGVCISDDKRSFLLVLLCRLAYYR